MPVDEVFVNGPPWSLRVCITGSEQIVLPTGYVYDSDWAQCIHMHWGRVRFERVYADTARVASLDDALTLREQR